MEKIVHVRHLRPGVFVSRLDRPWLGTPFLLQGFRLGSWHQVEEVTRCCSYVYIDPQRGDDLPEAMDPARHVAETSTEMRVAALSHPPSPAYPVKFKDVQILVLLHNRLLGIVIRQFIGDQDAGRRHKDRFGGPFGHLDVFL